MLPNPLMSIGFRGDSGDPAAARREAPEVIPMRTGSPPARRETIDRGIEQEDDNDRSTVGFLDTEDLEDDENTADEKNENLSQADLSSVGSVAVEMPPPIRSLVYLGDDKCRVPMACKQPDGSQVLAFCGHLAASTMGTNKNNSTNPMPEDPSHIISLCQARTARVRMGEKMSGVTPWKNTDN
jgi:hypothetical protein